MKRILALALSFTMLFSCLAQPVTALAEAITANGFDNALHFIVRHWHSDEVGDELFFQKDELEKNGDRYYVVVEGYIVPDNDGYAFYLVDQKTKEPKKVEDTITSSPYVESIDSENGIIVLTQNAIADSERFSTFSVSAGHSAVTYGEDDIAIKYDPEVHLVKSHVFYIRESDAAGDMVSQDGHEVTDGKEHDTARVYTWKKDGAGHTAGEIVVGENGKVYMVGEELPDDIVVGTDVEETKVYNTQPGLHTDKTASIVPGDGRTFDLELEAWYVEGLPAQIGMVLDASGSMAFTTDAPKRIKPDLTKIAGIRQLPAASGQTEGPDGGWEQYFLTQEQVDQILNKTHTDNSQLSVSGYSYFVYDSSDSTKEYAPLGYWEGVVVKTKYAFKKNTESNVQEGWPGDHSDLRMTPSGMHVSGQDSNSSPSSTGILLDVTPSGDEFTISFTLYKKSGDPQASERKTAELMYIGPMSGDSSEDSYYRLIRDEGGSANRLRGNQNTGRKDWITDINSVFIDNTTHTVTLVFKDGQLTSYLDGEIGVSGSGGSAETGVNAGAEYKPFTEKNIIFNGIQDEYTGAPIYIDDIYVFDTALSADDVKNTGNWKDNQALKLIGLYEFTSGKPESGADDGTRTWLRNSITDTYASKLTQQEDVVGSAKITVPTIAKTSSGRILGSINTNGGIGTASAVLSHVEAGWYYITHSGNWGTNYTGASLLTGKRLVGIPGSMGDCGSFTDSIILPNGASGGGTGYTYQPSADTPILFYVDHEGYLRCFYSRSSQQQESMLCSYVYELDDSEYVKTESLQRALGSFVTDLKEISPSSEVSAVRFSAKDVGDLGNLVLLDWTNDAGESAGILSLKRGNGGSLDSVTGPNGVEQYNYGLTGSTSTQQGLQAFWDYLAAHDKDNANKFLIIFTDGNDTDLTSAVKTDDLTWNGGPKKEDPAYMEAYLKKINDAVAKNALKAIDLINQLKEKGYTVFSVLLTGGPVELGTQAYDEAHVFLRELAGSKNDTTTKDRDVYFFSVDSARADMDDMLTAGEDILARIFTDKIIEMIKKSLTKYSVMDYIDPRFDLVDKDGKVWHLNADGSVVVGDGSATDSAFTVTKDTGKEFKITSGSDRNNYNPLLHYDNGLYYLEWTGRTIPSNPVQAEHLAVWKARVTVRAKDDFIGGNAILTNGNLEHMNWVFWPEDDAPSSGVDRMIKKEGVIEYPSKGFPRTTVNVQTPTGGQEIEEVIYMGETVLDVLFRNLIEELKRTKPELVWYWEYLERYAAYASDTSYEELLGELSEKNAVTVPYYYLPNEDQSNQTGTEKHMGDLIGNLTYTWDGDSERLNTPTKTTEPIKGKLTVKYEPIEAGERETLNNTKLIQEKNADGNVYQWDPVYKPAPGKSGSYEGEFSAEIDIASGEIVLELVVPSGVSNFLSSRMAGRTISYQAELWRAYGAQEEKVATLIAEYTVPGAVTGSDGVVRVNAANYQLESEYAEYVKDYGLPIGTYTVRPAQAQNEGGGLYEFTPLEVVGGSDGVYADRDAFSVYGIHGFDEPGKAIWQLLAPYTQGDPVTVELGTAPTQHAKYTDDRYAALRVRVEVSGEIPDVPVTGDDSRAGMWFALMAFSALALIAMLRPRRKDLGA